VATYLTWHWLIMANTPLNLDSLTSDPSYDFIKMLQSDNDYNPDFDIGTPYEMNSFDCHYSDLVSYNNSTRNNSSFTIMSLNIQSISAKYNEFKELIITMSKCGTSPDVICLQELWSFPAQANFSLPGYNKLIFKLRANDIQGGGGRLLC